MKTYFVDYYLPNQSHLFSDPFRYVAKGVEELNRVLEVARKNGYDVVSVFCVVNDNMVVPVGIYERS